MHSRILGLLAVLSVGGLASAQLPTPAMNPAPPPSVMAQPGFVPGGVQGYPAAPNYGAVPIGSGAVSAESFGATADEPVWYGSADYLLWQVRKGVIPAVATTMPIGLIAVNFTGPGGVPTTGYAPISIFNQVSFGGGPFTNIGGQQGFRVGGGFWADPDMSWGVEATFSMLFRGSDDFAAISSQGGNQFILNTGFTNNVFGPGIPPQLLASFPVFVVRETTSSLVGNHTVSYYSGDIHGRCVGYRLGGIDIGGLLGFRFTNFNDSMTMVNNVRLFQPVGIPPTTADATASLSRDLTFQTTDRTRIYNYFYGAQIGMDMDAKFGACFINTRLKAAFGNMHQVADVQGTTTLINNDPGRSPAGYAIGGGLMSGPLQNGRHTRDRFGFIPEVNAKLGYQLTDWLRGYVGYDGILLVNAARAAASVSYNRLNTTVSAPDTNVNININQPTFRFKDQDIWIQGISAGFEARW